MDIYWTYSTSGDSPLNAYEKWDFSDLQRYCFFCIVRAPVQWLRNGAVCIKFEQQDNN
jgi:hypothetical protein